MDQPFVMTSWVTSCLKGLEFKGWDRQALFAQSGVDPNLLNEPVFPAPALNALFKAAAEQYNVPEVGLEARHGITPNSFHALSLAVMASDDLWSGLARMIRFNDGITDAAQFFLAEEGDDGVFGFREPDPENGFNSMVHDAILATTLRTCRFIHPQSPALRRVEMGRAQPSDTSFYQSYFKAPLHWGAPRYALHFDPDYLRQPSMHANPTLVQENERLCTAYFAAHHTATAVRALRAYLLQHLADSDINLNAAAEALERGTRSLQRELNLDGTSFRQLLDDVRRQEAQRYLQCTSMSISRIAHAIGFTDTGNFSRAFKRWFGCSPYRYRQASQ